MISSIDHERLHIFTEKKTCQVKLPPEHQMHTYANDNPLSFSWGQSVCHIQLKCQQCEDYQEQNKYEESFIWIRE